MTAATERAQRLVAAEMTDPLIDGRRVEFTFHARFGDGHSDKQRVTLLHEDGEWFITINGKPHHGPRRRPDAPGMKAPGEVLSAHYEALIRGEFRRAVRYHDPRIELPEMRMAGDLRELFEQAWEQQGGLEAVEVLDWDIDADQAIIHLRLHLADGSSENLEQDMVRFDGLWYIESISSEPERPEPTREIQPVPLLDPQENVPPDPAR